MYTKDNTHSKKKNPEISFGVHQINFRSPLGDHRHRTGPGQQTHSAILTDVDTTRVHVDGQAAAGPADERRRPGAINRRIPWGEHTQGKKRKNSRKEKKLKNGQ